MKSITFNQFCVSASLSAITVALMYSPPAIAEERPAVSNPQQTSGDKAVQPKWNEALTITVGLNDADIVGRDHRAIQSAVDYVARLGGGTAANLASALSKDWIQRTLSSKETRT